MWLELALAGGAVLLLSQKGAGVLLSDHFTLAELTASATARAHGIDNTPGPGELANLQKMLQELAEPLRAAVGPLKVTSGYRSAALNDLIEGAATSRHMTGEAIDVAPRRLPSAEAMVVLHTLHRQGRAVVDQAILYHPTRGGHLHLGWSARAPRGQFLYAGPTGGYQAWRP